MKRKKFILVDGHALLHRAFHALPELTTSRGELVNAVYGFFLIFLNAIKELKPDYIAVCFDRPEPTFRHKKFKDYKAHRPETPEALVKQIPVVKEGLKVFGIPVLEKQGFEADDLIASLVRLIREKYPWLETVIVTGDLDTLQLVGDGVKVLTLRKGLTDTAIYDERAVRERFGFAPSLLSDYKALRGDPSDNIPGVKGIGDKTARELVQKYGSLKEIYSRLAKGTLDAPQRVLRLLKEQKSEAFLSKELAEVRSDLKIEFGLEDFAFKGFDYQKVFQWFRKMEFKSLLNRIPRFEEQPSLFSKERTQTKKGWRTVILEPQDLERFYQRLKQHEAFVFDVETSSLDRELIGISFCFSDHEAYFLPVADFSDYQLTQKKKVFAWLQKIFKTPSAKIGHNLKYDYKILKRYQIEAKPLSFDTMIASWLLDPETRNHNLDRLAFVELGYEKINKDQFFGKKEQFDLRQLSLKKVAEYSAEDSWATYKLYHKLAPRIKELDLDFVFQKIEMPLVEVLASMEDWGIKIDVDLLEKIKARVEKQIAAIQTKVFRLAGRRFNLNSPLQLREVLFHHLKLDSTRVKKTKTGLSTAASELEKMRGEHKIIDLILRYRELAKLKNTYLEALPKMVDKEGRLHTSFNQTATATGRLSSSDPNLQNIPVRTALGRSIRKAFIAEKGKVLIGADYSQIELRVVAHLSKDPNMIKAFLEDQDIHTATASLIYKVPLSKVTPAMRRVAKTVNFGVIYGMSPFGLAQSLGVSQHYARQFIEKYFALFPRIQAYTRETVKKAQKLGYVETLFGRRRYLKEINSRLPDLRAAAERAAINMPVQGTAADIIKLAMIKIFKKSPFTSLRMLLQVHDELVFEVDRQEADKAAAWVKEVMEKVVKLRVPLKAEVSIASSWGEMKK